MTIKTDIPTSNSTSLGYGIPIIAGIIIIVILVGAYLYNRNNKDNVIPKWMVATLITIIVIGATALCVQTHASIKPAMEKVNTAIQKEWPEVSNIECPALPKDTMEQNDMLSGKETRVKCSWKYDSKTIDGSLLFNISDATGNATVTLIGDDGAAWCPVEWKADGNCVPVTK